MTARYRAQDDWLLKDGEPVDPASLTEEEKVEALKQLVDQVDEVRWNNVSSE